MEKTYTTPIFHLISQDEKNKVFFTASGSPAVTSLGASLKSMTKTNGSW